MSATLAVLAASEPTGGAVDARLLVAAIVGIAAIIALITWWKIHPFLALAIGAIGVGIGAGLGASASVDSFAKGFGATMGGVGILIGFGAMFGKLLADSGGAERVVDTLVGRANGRTLPWMMALVGAVIGLPMFFEVGLVLLIPVVILVARRSGRSLISIAIPTLAGLSAMHGLVPPHPGPLVAVQALHANLGLTLALGVLVAVPTVIVSGPLFGNWAARWVQAPVPALFANRAADRAEVLVPAPVGNPAAHRATAPTPALTVDDRDDGSAESRRRPSFRAALFAILLPVFLMLGRAIVEVAAPQSTSPVKTVLDFLGIPMVALGLAVIVGMVVLGRGGGMNRDAIKTSLESSLPPIAGILLIVGAGGGFKQVLVDTGIGDVIAKAIEGSSLPVLLLAWLVAVVIRVATGSATVATVTASGILAPVAAELSSTHVSLMVLAIGSGSLFLSHVNDAGFWMVKEYLGLTVSQNLKTWTVMECLVSVTGLAGALALSVVI